MRDLDVFFRGSLVGSLRPQAGGQLAFEYAPGWIASPGAFAISVSLPLGSGPNATPAAHAFFANLLPEGALREAVARRLGISPGNDAALLAAIGGECAGALTILPDGERPGGAGGYQPLAPAALADMARRHSVLPEVAGARSLRLSLAGAQDKLPVRLDDDGSLWLPTGGAPTTHILKVPSRDFAHLPANEVLTTRLARALSLDAVDIRLLDVDGVPVAAVRRYDRVRRGDRIERLHQEDLCQALGLPPGTKYEEEGGPRFSDAVRVVREQSTDPARDTRQLLRWLLFCLLGGNADGHGKNLALRYGEEGMRLAPAYDLVCTRVYSPGIDRRLAMSVGGQRDPDRVGRRHLEALAAEVGVGRRLVFADLEQMAASMPEAFEQVAAPCGDAPIVPLLRTAIVKQCRRVLRLLRG